MGLQAIYEKIKPKHKTTHTPPQENHEQIYHRLLSPAHLPSLVPNWTGTGFSAGSSGLAHRACKGAQG